MSLFEELVEYTKDDERIVKSFETKDILSSEIFDESKDGFKSNIKIDFKLDNEGDSKDNQKDELKTEESDSQPAIVLNNNLSNFFFNQVLKLLNLIT
jgi:hypothetical protein